MDGDWGEEMEVWYLQGVVVLGMEEWRALNPFADGASPLPAC
jgi:hypothetical protein